MHHPVRLRSGHEVNVIYDSSWRRPMTPPILKFLSGLEKLLPRVRTVWRLMSAGFLVTSVLYASGSFAQSVENQGDAAEDAGPGEAPRRYVGPYCGVYCIYSLLVAYGKPCDIRDLLDIKYIPVRQGSRLSDLRTAAEDFGLHAVVMNNLTTSDLRRMSVPCILHVRRSEDRKEFDHFLVYLGTEAEGFARIYDPPQEPSSVPFHDLAFLWNGRGMLVSDSPIKVRRVLLPAYTQFACYGGGALVIILIAHSIRRRVIEGALPEKWRSGIRAITLQAAGTAIIAALFAVSYHLYYDQGLLAHADARTSMRELYRGTFIPRVSTRRLKTLIDRAEVVVVDARRARDYSTGHIEGAINVPVGSDEDYLREAMAGVPKDATIVVYCQTASCPFGEIVADELMSNGFQAVRILRGGRLKWTGGDSEA